MRDIETSRDAGRRYQDWQLDDSTRPNAQNSLPIPFDYEGTPKLVILNKETGIDYAAFYLRPYYRNLLASNGIRPFPDPWRKDIKGDFTAYVLLGVPYETVGARVVDGIIYQKYQPTAIGLTRIDQPTGSLTRGEWFYAKLPDTGGEYHVDSIVGMSGGPIIGFGKDEDNHLCYWLLALQSGWSPSEREIRACPIAIFARAISEGMQKVLSSEKQPRDE